MSRTVNHANPNIELTIMYIQKKLHQVQPNIGKQHGDEAINVGEAVNQMSAGYEILQKCSVWTISPDEDKEDVNQTDAQYEIEENDLCV